MFSILLAENVDWTLKSKTFEKIENQLLSENSESNNEEDDDEDEDDKNCQEKNVKTSEPMSYQMSSPLPSVSSPKVERSNKNNCESGSDESIISNDESVSSLSSNNYDSSHLIPSDPDNNNNNNNSNNNNNNDSFHNYSHKKLHFRNNNKLMAQTTASSSVPTAPLPQQSINVANDAEDADHIQNEEFKNLNEDLTKIVKQTNINYEMKQQKEEQIEVDEEQHEEEEEEEEDDEEEEEEEEEQGKGEQQEQSHQPLQQERQQPHHQLEPHQIQFQQQYMILFNCKICGKGFKHRRSLNRHVKLHTGEKHFKCTYCDTAFARSDHLKAHIRTHNNSKPFKCSICQCGYNTQSALKVHIAHHHHTKSKYKCLNCCKEFDSKYSLDDHIFNVHDVANKSDRNEDDTLIIAPPQHQQIKESTPSPVTQPLMSLHQQINSPLISANKTFFCKYCSQICLGEASYKKHLNEEHKMLCNTCNTLFQTINDFEIHLKNCSNEQKREIYYCRQPHPPPPPPIPQQQQQQQMLIIPQQQQQQYAAYNNPNKRLRFETPPNSLTSQQQQQQQQNIIKYSPNANLQTSPQRHLLSKNNNNLPVYVTNYYGPPVPSNQQLVTQSPHSITLPPPALRLHANQIPTQSLPPPPPPPQPQQQYPPNQNNNYCELCNSHFNNIDSFHAHMKTHPNYIYNSLPQQQGLIVSQQSLQKQVNTDNATKLPFLTSILTKNDAIMSDNSPVDDVLRDFCIREGHYSCASCNLSFSKAVDQLDHMKLKHCVEVYRCVLCKDVQLFDNLQLLKQHFILAHGSKQSETFRCKICNSIHRQLNDFLQHLKQIHRIDCNLMMPPQSPTQQQQQQHNSIIVSNGGISPTQKQQLPLLSPSQLNQQVSPSPLQKSILHQQLIKPTQQLQQQQMPTYMPIKQPMNASYKCSNCNILFEKEIDFRQHIQQEHEAPFYKCIYCSSKFLNQIQLDNHIETNHMIMKSSDNNNLDQVPTSPTTTTSLKPRYQILNKQLLQYQQQAPPTIQQQQQQQQVFKCPICDLKFPREDLLNSHKINDHNIQNYNSQQQHSFSSSFCCKYCNNSFSNRQQLEKHVRIHLSSIDLKCNICDKMFDNVQLLNEHKMVHMSDAGEVQIIQNSKYSQPPSTSTSPSPSSVTTTTSTSMSLNNIICCGYCKQIINDEIQYREHYFKHNNEHNFQSCAICKQKINSESDLLYHLNFHFKSKPKAVVEQQQQQPQANVIDMYNCYFCSRILKQSVDEIDYKYDPVTNKLRRLCKLCSTKYANDKQKQQQQLQQQQQQQQLLQNDIHSPNSSSNQSSSATILKIGKNKLEYLNDYYYCIVETNENDDDETIKLNGDELRCPKCNVKFESFELLSNHYESSHKVVSSMNSVRTFTCIKCQYQYSNENEIREHVQEHKKSEMCELCKNVFHTPAQLESHLLSKHEFPNGIFTCPICHESFAKSDNLFSHTVTHGTDGRFYKCHHCEQSFAFKTQFLNHLYIHKANVKINEEHSPVIIKEENCCEVESSSAITADSEYSLFRNSTPRKRRNNSDNMEDDESVDERRSVISEELSSTTNGRNRSINIVESLNSSERFISNNHENSNSSCSLNNSNNSKKLNLYSNHKEHMIPERNEFRCVLCDHVSLSVLLFFLLFSFTFMLVFFFELSRHLNHNQFFNSILLQFMQMNPKRISMI